VPVEIIRSGKHLTIEAKVGELKEEQVALAKTEEPGGNWGMQVGEITPEVQRQFRLQSNKGVVVRRVAPGSSAADAGLQPGDVVLEVNKNKISSVKEFVAQAKQAKGESKPSLLLVQRGTATLYTVIKPLG
jgi:serine protease Do